MNISVFGLGKLGSVLAAIYANSGHHVTGVDLNTNLVDQINNQLSPFNEPHLSELLQNSKNNLIATSDVSYAIKNSSVSFIIVPTPSNVNGFFVNDFIIGVIKKIGVELKNKNGHHLIIINSTVMPGSCSGPIKNILESSSGKKIGTELGLVYSPEFIALGNIVNNMQNPDLILIGESDKESGDLALELNKSIIKNEPIIHRMNLTNAEIVKISINTFVTTKISYANMISQICDHLPDTDVEVVLNAVGSDSRIGFKYLKAATGYGGPCSQEIISL